MSALVKNYNRKKISFKRGKGSFLYATNGKKYLDFVQGIAVNSLGHCNPYLTKAINLQAKKVWHVSNAFIIPELSLIHESIITPNVIKALDEIHDRKIEMINTHVPRWIQPAFRDFAGVKNSKIYNAFKDGTTVYLAKAFQKTVA